MKKMSREGFSFPVWLVVLLLLSLFWTSEASEATDSSCPSMGEAVISPGTLVNENARFPLTVVGDWERVLAAPEITVVTTDVFWSEGPIVRPSKDGSEVFYTSDTVRAIIYKISTDPHNPGAYQQEIWATHSGGIDPSAPEHANVAEPGSNGMTTDSTNPDFVIINQHGLSRVIRCKLDDHTPGAPLSECPDLQVIVDSYEGVPFNSPNDVVVHPSDGSVWFTDPIYGLLEKDRFCDEFHCSTGMSYLDDKSQLGFQGVYRVDRSNDAEYKIELVSKYHRRPNGLAFAPDRKRLWVADSTNGNPSWTAYDLPVSQQAAEVLTPATLGELLGRTQEFPKLTGGEGTYKLQRICSVL